MNVYDIIFYLFAAVTLLSAFFVVTTRNIVRAAFFLLFTFFGVAGIYVLLGADCVAIVQLIVYIGGILILFGGLEIGGEGRNLGFDANGNFKRGDPNDPGKLFAVSLSVGSADGSSMGWPSWLPVKINTLGIIFGQNFDTDASDFELILSVSVTGLPAVAGLKFSGAIEGVRISPKLLLEGRFPITRIHSFGVSVSGKLFGGELSAALIGGILRIDQNGALIGDLDDSTPVAARVFIAGVQGGFTIAGLGLTIQFALSELGPLGVFRRSLSRKLTHS